MKNEQKVIEAIATVPTRPGFENLENEAVEILLGGIPRNTVLEYNFATAEAIVRSAFRGGICAAHEALETQARN